MIDSDKNKYISLFRNTRVMLCHISLKIQVKYFLRKREKNNSIFFFMCYLDEIENSEESEYFSPSTPGGGGNNSNYRYQRAATPNGRERKRVLR